MKKIKTKLVILTLAIFLLIGNVLAQGEAGEAGEPVDTDAAGLNLNAVAEVFKDSEHLEDFEKTLNNPESGINNLDLDENGEVDYLRVEESVNGDTHLIALQSVLGENQFQDVATIAVEKAVNDYNFQVYGTPAIYGANYYVVPRYTNLGTWSLINWLYRPGYRPYSSVFGWRTYPRWWRVRRPLALNVYRTRTVRFVGKRNFASSGTVRVKTINKVKYKPRTSTLVRKKKVVSTNGNKTVVKKKGVKKTTNPTTGKTTVKKKGVKKIKNNKTGKTKVKKGKKKTVKKKSGKKTKKVKKKKN